MSKVQQQKTITSNAIASLQLHFDAAEITDVLGLFHDIDYDYCVHAHKLKLAYLKLQLIIKQLHLTLRDKMYLPFFGLSLKKCLETIHARIEHLCVYYRDSILEQTENTIRVISDEFETMARGLIVVPTVSGLLFGWCCCWYCWCWWCCWYWWCWWCWCRFVHLCICFLTFFVLLFLHAHQRMPLN